MRLVICEKKENLVYFRNKNNTVQTPDLISGPEINRLEVMDLRHRSTYNTPPREAKRQTWLPLLGIII